MDIFKCPKKCPKKGGSKSVVHSCLRPFSTKYFRRICLWIMIWRMPRIRIFEINHFWTEYFRRVCPWNINGQAFGFEAFEINQFWTEYFRLKRDNSERVRFYERGEFRRSLYAWYSPASQTWHTHTHTHPRASFVFKPAFSSHGISSQLWNHYNQTIQPSKNLHTLLSQDPPKKHPPFSRIF